VVRARRLRVLVTYPVETSNAVKSDDPVPHGTTLLACDLTPDQLRAAPALASAEALLIVDLSTDEDDAFAAALDS